MTDVLAIVTGAAVAVAEAATATSALEAVPTLSGTAILVWLIIDGNKEKKELMARNREIADRCSNCVLARTANAIMIEHAKKDHEDCD